MFGFSSKGETVKQYTSKNETFKIRVIKTHVAASQLPVSSSANHAAGHQVTPPVGPGAGSIVNHGKKGLLQNVSKRSSSFNGEQCVETQACSQ